MGTNRCMPPGVIIPELPYTDVLEAAEWLSRVFGFKKRLQIGQHRFQLSFGDSSIVATQRGEDANSSYSIMVRIDDVDLHYEHVISMGVQPIHPPTDYPYGERPYTVEDIGGHRWTFSQSVSNVDPGTWGGELFE